MSIALLPHWSSVFFVLFLANMMCLFFILAIHFFVPKIMQRTYFKEPYFSPTEVELFTGFPLAYMRTAMMMRLAGWPESGKKRGIPANAHEVAPFWFQVVSRVFIRILLTVFASFIFLVAVLTASDIVQGTW